MIEDGSVRRTDSREFAGRPIQLPMLDVHTVGAGGGSIAWRDGGGALRVGPRSAGARPGPACYGNGGEEPTVTDANLLLGYLGTEGLAGGVTLDREAAEHAVARLADDLGLDPDEAARGIIEVANAEMVRAMRVVTVERGVDPRGFALLPFGGAGPLHAAAIAAELGIRQILCPRSGGVLSALGLIASERRRDTARTVMLAGARADPGPGRRGGPGTRRGPGSGRRRPARCRLRASLLRAIIRAAGSRLPGARSGGLEEAFAAEHERRYGYRESGGAIELVNAICRPLPRCRDRFAATRGS